MIISTSRRTDIPRFFTGWFMQRVREGFFCSRNPFNPADVRRTSLASADVEAIVFWSKDPAPMLDYLSNARWIDGERVIAWDGDGWDVIDVRSGQATRVEWGTSGRQLLGLCPLPGGRAVAITEGQMNVYSYGAADLVVCDLEGRTILRRWSGITGTDTADFYRESLPVLYAGWPGGGERTGSLPSGAAPEARSHLKGTSSPSASRTE